MSNDFYEFAKKKNNEIIKELKNEIQGKIDKFDSVKKKDIDIDNLLGSQSKTVSAFKRPFCLSPIFIVGFFKCGTSINPLEEFPITASTYLIQDKYLSCPREEKTKANLLSFT